MSLWWVKKEQLDKFQLDLIENLPMGESFLITGPPGSGKTNVLLRRAQFVRSQGRANILVLSFTRPLTEFVKTGCYDSQRREIFPRSCVTTLETWLRWLYDQHGVDLPPQQASLVAWKRALADNARGLAGRKVVPRYDALFVDEAQDLLKEEVAILREWTDVLFLVGDERQKIYDGSDNLNDIRSLIPRQNQRNLPNHYRLAPVICRAADRILIAEDGKTLESRSHYQGPRPGTITPHTDVGRDSQLTIASKKLKQQMRAYGDLILQGDLLGVVVPRRDDRETIFTFLEQDPELQGKSKIVRSREEHETGYDPEFSATSPICIVTVQGCKGLEFRAVHWLFCDDLQWAFDNEHYYTVVTRAKTQLDFYSEGALPQPLAKAYAERTDSIW